MLNGAIYWNKLSFVSNDKQLGSWLGKVIPKILASSWIRTKASWVIKINALCLEIERLSI